MRHTQQEARSGRSERLPLRYVVVDKELFTTEITTERERRLNRGFHTGRIGSPEIRSLKIRSYFRLKAALRQVPRIHDRLFGILPRQSFAFKRQSERSFSERILVRAGVDQPLRWCRSVVRSHRGRELRYQDRRVRRLAGIERDVVGVPRSR
jgi:hypothetical protein